MSPINEQEGEVYADEDRTVGKSFDENQERSRRLVWRRRMPCTFFSCTAVLTAAGLRCGDCAGVARHENGGWYGDIEVASVQCVLSGCFWGSMCAAGAGGEGRGGGVGDRERRVKARRTGFMKIRDFREREREREYVEEDVEEGPECDGGSR